MEVIDDKERRLLSGMDDHIMKPLRHGDLLNAINKLAGERGAQKHRHLMRRLHVNAPTNKEGLHEGI